MMKSVLLLAVPLVFAITACATRDRPAEVTPAPVIAAERAFAADGTQRGWVAAFRRAAAPDGITLSPGPVNAQESLAQIEGDGPNTLDWRPAYAGIAQSGDFGFTTGPFQVRGGDAIIGHFFTVWRRQPDGGWKWIFDAGTGVTDPGPAVAADADIPTLPVAMESAGSSEAAIAQITTIEAAMTSPDLVTRSLAHDARVNREGAPPAVGRAPSAALIAADGQVAYTALRREASSAGDMAFSMGEVRDQHEGAERLRYYARIWQKRPEGWRIVFDEIVPIRG